MKPTYDGLRVALDMSLRGWHMSDLAKAAGVSQPSIQRFISGKYQTASMAKKLAKALRKPIDRYLTGYKIAV